MNEDLRKEIEKVLDAKVRPELALHGGNIQVVGLEASILQIRMLGQCSGCPSVTFTMENLVNAELQEAFPDLKQVVLVNGVSDELISEAKAILKRRVH